ncbi:hypothetical protein [Streptomyces nodosus]|uniref:Heparin-binding hemagglutinin n=1 Tax=Streptomyces nodosus TaxID=40318 RepID=A0A0B5DMY0_9ACTN|nr:hypothetical protein [Streptomyces nodosus]AJE41337.1 hypothetical protein SNOD_15810 [Streptomyces nodosus]MBB4792507.1 hypothetical protein [Streptomyces nodosus]QEV39879.1 hypothetical protein CP978_16110 [Streptomyces nodosus]
MAITDDLRKTLSDPTPFYFAAGTADLALQQAKKVPGLVEQLRAEAPARFDAVRNTDPKVVQERAAARAKEARVRVKESQETFQAKVSEFVNGLDSDLKKFGGNLDADLKKLGETAQDLALRGVGVAAEYAVRARETYEKVAEHGEQAVKTWRGEAAEGMEDLAVAVEGRPEPVVVNDEPRSADAADAESSQVRKPVAKKAPAKKPVAKKSTPPAK